MPDSLPDSADINRLRFDLSDRMPVQASISTRTRAQDVRFDVHYVLELGIMLTGRMKRIYGSYEMEIGPGEIWLSGMWEPHGFRLLSASSQHIVCVIWPGFLAQTCFPEAPDMNWLAPFHAAPAQRPRVAQVRRSWFRALGERFRAALQEAPSRQRAWLRLLVLETLLELMRDWTCAQVDPSAGPDAYSRVNRAVQLVLSRHNLVTVAEAAQTCHMSRNRFAGLFREVMGLRFPAFALRHRLSGAARQLVETEDPLKAIAQAWGFTDDSHLHRVFKQHYGQSPDAYRRSLGSENIE